MSELQHPRSLVPIDADLRALARAFLRLLQDVAQKRKEAYRLAAHRWIATLPSSPSSVRPHHYLPDLPTMTQLEAHAYHVIFVRWDDLQGKDPEPGRSAEEVAVIRAARAFLSVQWGSRWLELFLEAEAHGPGGRQSWLSVCVLDLGRAFSTLR